MPLQDESPHPTIEARPMLWVGLATILEWEHRQLLVELCHHLVSQTCWWHDITFSICDYHALWKRCTCWSGVLADEIELHIASIENRSWYGTWFCDHGKIDCWRLCVDAAEAKNAAVASVFAHVILVLHRSLVELPGCIESRRNQHWGWLRDPIWEWCQTVVEADDCSSLKF